MLLEYDRRPPQSRPMVPAKNRTVGLGSFSCPTKKASSFTLQNARTSFQSNVETLVLFARHR